jgi:excisionase family DNA binding protein
MSASTLRKPAVVAQPPADPWMTVREASRALGIAPPTVLNRVIQGQLEAQTVAGRTFISRASVDRAVNGG